MAKSIQNVVMQGASGKIGKTLVFRQLSNGETVIANRAKPRGKKPLTPAQEAFRYRFQNAAYMAKIFSQDPILRPRYLAKAKPGQSAYSMALKDCLTAPQIKGINLDAYNGTIGSLISIRAVDDFKVASVRVRILKANDILIEKGFATLNDNGLDWTYVATVANTPPAGTKVEVTVSDVPGNETVEVATIA